MPGRLPGTRPGPRDRSCGRPTGAKPADKPLRVLVFSGAGWYRHPEIPRTNGWLVRLGQERGFVVDVTETPGDLTADRLAAYRVLVLNNANELGKLLDDTQKKAVEGWSRTGAGSSGSTPPWSTRPAGPGSRNSAGPTSTATRTSPVPAWWWTRRRRATRR